MDLGLAAKRLGQARRPIEDLGSALKGEAGLSGDEWYRVDQRRRLLAELLRRWHRGSPAQ